MKRGFIMLLWLAATLSAHGQWVKTEGPEGGSIGSIATDGDHLLATSTMRELYRHDGAGWTRLNTLSPARLFAVGATFFASTDSECYRSTDQGESWTEIPLGDGLLSFSADEGSLFAGVNSGLHASTDDGVTWSALAMQPPGHIQTHTYGSSLLFAAAIDSGGMTRLYRSIDVGRDWIKVGNGLPDGDFINCIRVKGPATVYVGTSMSGIYRSTDGGEHFTSFSDGIVPDVYGDFTIFQILVAGDNVLATTPTATYRLNDKEWQPISAWPFPVMAAPTTGEGNDLYVGSVAGVERADLEKGTWEVMNDGLRISTVNAMLADEAGVMVGTPAGVFRSNDKGETWRKLSNQGISGLVRSGSTLVGSVTTYLESRIVRSSDGGETWHQAIDGLEDQPLDQTTALVASNQGTIFLGFGSYFSGSDPQTWSGGGIYRSTDAGLTWQLASNGLPFNNEYHSPVADLAVDGTTVVAVTVSGIYRSTDNGEHWTKTRDIVKPWLYTLSAARFNGGTFYAGVGDTLYTSKGGADWTREIIPFPSRTRIVDVWFIGETPLVAATEYRELGLEKSHLFIRKDGGWKDIGSILPEGPIMLSYLTIGETVLAGADAQSVWRAPIATILGGSSGVEGPAGAATGLVLTPNPARDLATLSFTLDRATNVRLSIVNALGQTASTPFEGAAEAGEHRVTIDVSGLTEGMWFYRLEAEGAVKTGKFIATR